MGRNTKKGKNTTLAIFFLAALFLLIISSFLVKGFHIVKNSKFERGNSYSLYLSNEKKSEVITFNKDSNSITIVEIEGNFGDAYKFLEVPISGVIISPSISLRGNVSEKISDAVLKLGSSKNDINIYDALRMYIMSRTAPLSFEKIGSKTPEGERDKILSSIFSDPKIEKESIEIEIINESEEPGVGNRLSRLLSNMGGNVILVSTGNQDRKSGVHSGIESYSSGRISEVLAFPKHQGRVSKIADLTIIVGKDYKSLSRY